MRAAVIGLGRMGARPSAALVGSIPEGWLPLAHVEAFKHLPSLDALAICDTDSVAVERAKSNHGLEYGFSDVQDLLTNFRPDLLSVATRTPQKEAILHAAIQSGVRGIYVEKPLANSLKTASEILESATHAGVEISYGVNRRFHSAYRRARELVDSGEIGELRNISIEHGEGPLFWTHPHSTDLILFFAREAPNQVQAYLDPSTFEVTRDRHVDSDPKIQFASFNFTSGLSAQITRTGGLCTRLGGTLGTLTVMADGSSLEILRSRDKSAYFFDRKIETTLPGPSATVVALGELDATVREPQKNSLSISKGEIFSGLQMLLGCVWSHLQRNSPVDLSGIPTDLTVTGRNGSLYA